MPYAHCTVEHSLAIQHCSFARHRHFLLFPSPCPPPPSLDCHAVGWMLAESTRKVASVILMLGII